MNESLKRNVLDLIYNVGVQKERGLWSYSFIHGDICISGNITIHGVMYDSRLDKFFMSSTTINKISLDEISLEVAECWINYDYFKEDEL